MGLDGDSMAVRNLMCKTEFRTTTQQGHISYTETPHLLISLEHSPLCRHLIDETHADPFLPLLLGARPTRESARSKRAEGGGL